MRLNGRLERERIHLRTLDVSEVDERYVGWINDPEINRFLEVRFVRQTLEGTRAFVQTMNESPDNLLLGIFLNVDGRHIGNIKLGPINPHHHRGDIGIVIGEKDQWGQGHASAAIDAISTHAFETLGLHKVTAGYYGGNEGSGSAFLKAGFHQDGRLAEHWLSDGRWVDEILIVRFRGENP